ncbi:hypothetical protein [Mycoplasma sp. VS1572C]
MKSLKTILFPLALGSMTLAPMVALSCAQNTQDTSALNTQKTSLFAKADGKLNTINSLSPEEYKSLKSRTELLKAQLAEKSENELTSGDVELVKDLIREMDDKITALSKVVVANTRDELDEANAKVKELKTKVDKLTKNLEKLGVDVNQLLDSNNPTGVASSTEITRLTQEFLQTKAQYDAASDKVKTIQQKFISRDPSAIDAIKMVSRLNIYMIEMFKILKPEFAQNESSKHDIEIWTNAINQAITDADSIKLTYANSNNVYKALLGALEFTNILKSIETQLNINVISPFENQKFMDVLFDWRISDLDKLLQLQNKKLEAAKAMPESDETQKAAKDKKVQTFEENVKKVSDILESYKVAKSQGKDLIHQIQLYMKLEREAFDKFIYNPTTADEFKPSFDVTIKISAVPLLNQINDKESLLQFAQIVEPTKAKYGEFYKYNKDYMNSIMYANYFTSYYQDVVDMARSNLIQDFYTKDAILIYLKQFKYKLASYNIEKEAELAKIKDQNTALSQEINKGISKLYSQYLNLDETKQEKAIGQTYYELYKYFGVARRDALANREDTIYQAYDRLLALKKIQSQINTVNLMLNYFKTLGISKDDETMNKYLRVDKEIEKANKFKAESEKNAQKYQAIFDLYKSIVRKFKAMKFDATEAATIKEQAQENVGIITKFVEELTSHRAPNPDNHAEIWYFNVESTDISSGLDDLIFKTKELKTNLEAIANTPDDKLVEEYNKLKIDALKLGLSFYVDTSDQGETEEAEKYHISSWSPMTDVEDYAETERINAAKSKNKIKNYKDNAFFIPLNEVYILIRQGAIANSSFIADHSVTDKYETLDPVAYTLTTKSLEKLQQNNKVFRDITGAKANTIPMDNGIDPVVEAKNLSDLEKTYYQAHIKYFSALAEHKDNLESLKTELKAARDAYYNKLRNSELDGQVYIGELNPKPTYHNLKNDLENPAKILIALAEYNSIKDLLEFIYKNQAQFEN